MISCGVGFWAIWCANIVTRFSSCSLPNTRLVPHHQHFPVIPEGLCGQGLSSLPKLDAVAGVTGLSWAVTASDPLLGTPCTGHLILDTYHAACLRGPCFFFFPLNIYLFESERVREKEYLPLADGG